MNAHVAKDGMSFLPAAGSRKAAASGRSNGLTKRLTGAVQWLAQMPRRRAVLETLGSLSDHELSDIGLTRSDLPRVFDPAFVASRSFARRAGC